MRLLLTRPEPGAGATAARLSALGHEVVKAPMLRLEDTGTALPAGLFDAIAFTSLNGVLAFSRAPGAREKLALPVHAVGTRTAAQARAAGFTDVSDAAGDIHALARLLAERLPAGSRLLHGAGEDRAGDLNALLAPYGVQVDLCVLYRAVPVDTLPAEARSALIQGRLDAVLHYSPRSARALLDAVAAEGLMNELARLDHPCLSAAVAAPLLQAGLLARTAAHPDEDSLLALLVARS